MANAIKRIRETLEGLCADVDIPMEGVWYGACRANKLQNWNYFVFRRKKSTKVSTNNPDLQTFFEVNIIHEDAVPEGYVQTVIGALQAQADPGTKLKLASDDISYDYTFKGSTNMVVEIATIMFYHPEKRC